VRVRVVYDSLYGNTRKVAEGVAETMSVATGTDVPVQSVDRADLADIAAADLLVIGAPTHGAEASKGMQGLLKRIGAPSREGALVATFDTRLTWGFLEKHGFAAEKMASALQDKGWMIVGSPGGFLVGGLKKGPLKKGELERSEVWAREMMESLVQSAIVGSC